MKLQAFIIALMAAITVASGSHARQVPLYGGETLDGAKIKISSMGSGSGSQSSQAGNIGSHSIQVTTQGLYAGVFLNFADAVEIADPDSVSSYDYLEFTVRFSQTVPLGLILANNPRNITGDYYPIPLDRYGNYDDFEPIRVPRVRMFRVVLYSEDGRIVEHQSVVSSAPDDDGWQTVAVPLAKLGMTQGGKGFRLSKMALGTDYPETFYIGQIRVITDNSPITVDEIDPQQLGAYDPLVLLATAEAGSTSLVYSWDMNEADGIQEDAFGRAAYFSYKAPGNYVITLTVKDPDGIKQPAAIKIQVEVS